MTAPGDGAARDRTRSRSVRARGPGKEPVEASDEDDAETSPSGRPPGATRRVGPLARGISPGEIAALVFSLAWLGLNGWWVLTLDDELAGPRGNGPPEVAWTVLAVVLPVALAWVAAVTARTARQLRSESARLQAAIDAQAEHQLADSAALRRVVEDRIKEVIRVQAALSTEVAEIRTRAARTPALSLRSAAPRARRAIGSLSAGEKLPPEDFIRAFDFPRDEHDDEGFRVLRAALEQPATAPLVTATQDLLTLLAQDGIRMDDLTVHAADAVLWRALADGTRGSDVAALGGIRDRSSLALAGGRMKDDAVFRDAVNHFLQTFAEVFADFADRATDAEIMRFADTRTARAFMLTAWIAGLFA